MRFPRKTVVVLIVVNLVVRIADDGIEQASATEVTENTEKVGLHPIFRYRTLCSP